ncbi:NADH-dependent fumarate reductase [Strigomonas culicis]|uniref:fumarate reductase (NADH) n=1 Tax=Strigomonas culicis TaxID=28005 RepID=S9UB87_9TRYP|nr:NADH-dependent fumarate reductase [Strigomonas culicis]|eukprot:EPY28052.1 NADH-dependent fumarate reductase [Strigomonas culicis]
MLSERSADAINWLSSFGVPLTVLSQLGGASRKRCHRAPEKPDGTPLPIGFTLVKTLEQHLRTELAASVQIETSATLTRLLSQPVVLPSGREVLQVKGVEYRKASKPEGAEKEEVESRHLDADSVILATGGFSNDHTSDSLLKEYAPNLSAFPTTNGPWATGDGVKLARELGVALVDMDKVQLHPTGLLNPKDPNGRSVFLGPEALRGAGGILLNKSGERFINELDLRSVVSEAILKQDNVFPGSDHRRFAHCVLNEEAATLFGKGTLGFYWKKFGLFTYAEDVAALAQLIGCDEPTLRETLTQYEATSSAKTPCPITGKNVFPCVLGPQGPFYVAYVTPSIHYTMGGCLISPSAEIQSANTTALGGRQSILGLFGAGEVTGGVHGGNRLGGNSLLECVVFGRIAGRRASQPAVPLASPALPAAGGFVPATVREIVTEHAAEEQATSEGSRQLVLNLPHPLQVSGLALLQKLTLRYRAHGQTKTVDVRPCSLPSDVGSVAVQLPPHAPSAAVAWLQDLLPGDEVEIAAGEAGEAAALPATTTALYVVAAAPAGSPPRCSSCGTRSMTRPSPRS